MKQSVKIPMMRIIKGEISVGGGREGGMNIFYERKVPRLGKTFYAFRDT